MDSGMIQQGEPPPGEGPQVPDYIGQRFGGGGQQGNGNGKQDDGKGRDTGEGRPRGQVSREPPAKAKSLQRRERRDNYRAAMKRQDSAWDYLKRENEADAHVRVLVFDE